MWRTSQQVRLLCPWARHLMGCLYVCVVKHVVTGGGLTRKPEKGHFSVRASAEKFPGGPAEKITENQWRGNYFWTGGGGKTGNAKLMESLSNLDRVFVPKLMVF